MTVHAPLTDTTSEHDLQLLAGVHLQSFVSDPPAVGPFGQARLMWSVTAPDGVQLALDTATVPHNGQLFVSPPTTQSYHLIARAGHFSKPLGTVTVHVNMAQCITLDTGLLPTLLATKITDAIAADTTGVYFRTVPVPSLYGTTYVTAAPNVTITPGRLNVSLRLAQRIAWFPDAAVDIDVSFGLRVIPSTNLTVGLRRIVAIDEVIHADVSFPFYAWLIPGAMIGLQLAVDQGKTDARARAEAMIRDIVGPPSVPDQHQDLNTFFHAPHGTDKHDVSLYLDSDGRGVFAVTFCPAAPVAALTAVTLA